MVPKCVIAHVNPMTTVKRARVNTFPRNKSTTHHNISILARFSRKSASNSVSQTLTPVARAVCRVTFTYGWRSRRTSQVRAGRLRVTGSSSRPSATDVHVQTVTTYRTVSCSADSVVLVVGLKFKWLGSFAGLS